MSQELQDLLQWAKNGKIFVDPRIKFQITSDRGVICVAKEDIKNGKDLIKVPKDIALTPTLAASFFGDDWTSSHDRNQQLQLFLARLKFNDEDTFVDGVNISKKMAPYINFLPSNGRDTGLPYFWTEEEKYLLSGTDAEVFLKRFMDEIVEEWHSAITGLKSVTMPNDMESFYQNYKKGNYNKGMAYFLEQKMTWTSFQAYLWAHCILASRAFPFALFDPSNKLHKAFLVPVIDLLNHKNATPVRWYTSDQQQMVFSSLEDPSNMKKGLELFNNYGDKPNYAILLGYGFVIPDNKFDITTLSLKVPQNYIEAAKKFGVKLPDDASPEGINFVLTKKCPLPENLIDFFAFLVRLTSENNIYTTRMLIEGMANLRAILGTKVNAFKKFKMITDRRVSPSVARMVKVYRNLQKAIFLEAQQATIILEKNMLKKYHALSFKRILTRDKVFFNSLLLTFGVSNYNDLVAKKILDQAVLLWIVRNANKNDYKDLDPLLFPEFIYEEFQNVKKNVAITEQDVLEFRSIYKSLFPALSQMIPEVYNIGDWTPRNFIVAATVSDRLTFKRPTNNEVFFLKKEEAKTGFGGK